MDSVDRRTIVSQQPFFYHVNFPPVGNPVAYGRPAYSNDAPRPETRVTRWRGTPKPHTALFDPGFFRLPNEGTIAEPVVSGEIRIGEPTGGKRSRALYAETPIVQQRLKSGIIPGTVPVVAALPLMTRSAPMYSRYDR